ncbi:MAG: DUF4198 domain-containing protein [Planctomycetota bacterium]
MRRWVSVRRLGVTVLALMLLVSLVRAHFVVIIPERATIAPGESLTVQYFEGHPFEHEISERTPTPRVLALVGPSGASQDLLPSLKAVGGTAGLFQFSLIAAERGDHHIVAELPLGLAHDGGAWQRNFIKVPLHVKAQIGWDRVFGQRIEIVPLTRPYGLEAGMVFRGRVLFGGKPLADRLVEVEQYSPSPPAAESLPPEIMITRVVKTDELGTFIVSLDKPGWWALKAEEEDGLAERDGKKLPLLVGATYWLHMEPRDDRRHEKR